MPTVLRIGAYRFFFYASDGDEPPHVHVEREDRIAKFWLNPVRLQRSGGFAGYEIALLLRTVTQNQKRLLGQWDEYFNN